MLLAIDIGNTNTVFGFFDGRRLVRSFRAATDHTVTADQVALLIRQFERLGEIDNFESVAIASVVPRLTAVYRQMVEQYYRCAPLLVSDDLKLNITFDYPNPKEIGADRICNSAAVFDRCGGAAIVVDFGTATTFDIITAAGAYTGGVIAPGIETAQSALAHRAAQLFKISFGPPAVTVGKSTEDALRSGFYHGAVGQTDYIIEKILAEIGSDAHVVATGGLAPLIAPESKYIKEVLPDITLEGLRLIYDLNQPD